MWPWIKRWRDWAMNDLWPLHRLANQPPVLRFGYEKAGLGVADQPIPWNADAVLVECLLPLPMNVARRRNDFLVRLGHQEPIVAENLGSVDGDERCMVFFRLPVPAQTQAAELLWRHHVLGKVTLPVISRDEFLKNLTLQMPTVLVCLGSRTVPCRTFVATQGRSLIAGAVLTSPTPLAPLVDLGLRVEFRATHGTLHTVPVPLSQSQLKSKCTLVLAMLSRLPRRSTEWHVTWLLADCVLAKERVRSISTAKFHRSLRLADGRFVLQTAKGKIEVARQLTMRDGLQRVGPCFLVTSSEPGMAGVCKLQVRAQVIGAVQAPVLAEQEVLITDGPTAFVPGTEDIAQLAHLSGFELWLKSHPLGSLPLSPAPTATFSSEGGFKAPGAFPWSSAAEELLNDRLGRLLRIED